VASPRRIGSVRVLQLGPFPPPHGGVQTNLVAIHRALRARGDDARVANITSTRRPGGDGVDYPAGAAELLVLLVRCRYDIVHLHIGGHLSARLLLLCLFCTLLPGVRTVVTFHSGGYASSAAGRKATARGLRGFVFRRVDRVIAVNSEIAAFFRRLGVSAARVRLILPHSVDTAAVAQSGSADALPTELATFLADHSPVLTTVGLLEPEYAIESQLVALHHIREERPDAGLIIVGSGSLHDHLRRTIAASAPADHVLLCGDVAHENTLRLIARSDVLLRTTLYDGDSVAVREALGLGTPVVATDNGMRPNGVHLYPVGDARALDATIARALAAGRSAAAEADDRNIDAVLELYRELVDPSHRSSLSVASV
jgi:glycosyltransferase involved in cell wall biosynthesis